MQALDEYTKMFNLTESVNLQRIPLHFVTTWYLINFPSHRVFKINIEGNSKNERLSLVSNSK